MRVVEDEAKTNPRKHRGNCGNSYGNKKTTQAREGTNARAET
jgi:hypothetical protein